MIERSILENDDDDVGDDLAAHSDLPCPMPSLLFPVGCTRREILTTTERRHRLFQVAFFQLPSRSSSCWSTPSGEPTGTVSADQQTPLDQHIRPWPTA